jgi:hypothetical protein
MLYREIIAVCSEIHTKHINTVCGQNVELPNVKPVGASLNQILTYIFKEIRWKTVDRIDLAQVSDIFLRFALNASNFLGYPMNCSLLNNNSAPSS